MKTISNWPNKVSIVYYPDQRVRKFAERHSAVNQDLTIKKDCVALRAC